MSRVDVVETDHLAHYGILGMKWGVRRYQPYPKGKHGTFLGQTRDEDIRIKKGTKAYRTSVEKDIKDKKGLTYISLDKLDSMKYLGAASIKKVSKESGLTPEGTISIGLENNDNQGRPYQLELRLTEDLIAPSYQKTMEAFINTIDELGGAKKVVKRGIIEFEGRYEEKGKKFIKDFGNLKIDECRDNAYKTFCNKMMQNTKAREIFFNKLKDQGYNALVAEDDKNFSDDRHHSFSKTPLIIFSKDSVKQTSSTALSDKDVDFLADLFFEGLDDYWRKKEHPEAYEKWRKYAGVKRFEGNM